MKTIKYFRKDHSRSDGLDSIKYHLAAKKSLFPYYAIILFVLVIYSCNALISQDISNNILNSISMSTADANSTNSTNSTNSSALMAIATDPLAANQILYLQRNYFRSGDVVNISINNLTAIDNNSQISLEISLKEDPNYNFRYLGSVGESVLFVPTKAGTYVISLYKITGSNMALLTEKSFLVYDTDQSQCRNYYVGDTIEINFRSYPRYNYSNTSTNLPMSVNIVYQDDMTGNTETYLYSQEIKQSIFYEISKSGKYTLIADEEYLDCFVGSESSNNSANISIAIGNLSSSNNQTIDPGLLSNVSIQSLLDEMMLKNISNNLANTTNGSNFTFIDFTQKNNISFDVSQDLNFSIDRIIEMKATSGGIVLAKILRGDISGVSELWIFDLNSGKARKLGYGNNAPAEEFSLGLKESAVFWVSENNMSVYAYDANNDHLTSADIPPYDLSRGELGHLVFTNSSLENWTVLMDSSQFYFFSNVSGQVFSDDDLSVKESFRQKMSLDHQMNPEEIASLDLEIDRNFVVVQ